MPMDPSNNVTTGQDALRYAQMEELFEAIGMQIFDDRAYDSLVEHVESSGERSHTHRRDLTLHGRCWKIGNGLEVWSVLAESPTECVYLDCRPAFRGRYVHVIEPWELIEYDEDGEAIVHGTTVAGTALTFELQNLTEVDPLVFREPFLRVSIAGLAYAARMTVPFADTPRSGSSLERFAVARSGATEPEQSCDNEYDICGRVLGWRTIRNAATGAEVVWLYVDAGSIRLEIVVNRRSLTGSPQIGQWISASVWLQGFILEAAEVDSRYEGVDRDFEVGEFWSRLQRRN